MRKLRMAASLRPMFLSSGRWFLCVSILESEMEKKTVLKFGSQHRRFVVNLNFMWQVLLLPIGSLPRPKPGPSKVPDSPTAQIPRGRQFHVTCLWSTVIWKEVFLFVAHLLVYHKDHYNIFHKLIESMQSLMSKGAGGFRGFVLLVFLL